MKVLVTGHHGYIGSVLAPLVAAAGHEVTGLDAFYYRGCDLGPPVDWRPALERDVRDVAVSDLAGFDAVVHLAALSNDPVGDLNPSWTYDINLDGSVDLARRAKEAGVERFVFASSCSMYGAAPGDELVTVAGRSYCGGPCAHWMTLVVRNRPDGWTVTGTTGPIAIS